MFHQNNCSSEKNFEIQIQGLLEAKDKPAVHRTIFHGILESDLPPHEKTYKRLSAEAATVIVAGSATVSVIMKTTIFHVLDNPDVAQKLHDELQMAMPDPSQAPPPLGELQKLPYLSAIILEGLRMGHGVSHRLQRIKPDGSLKFHQWKIPAGTPVSMTSVFIHDNPTIFPNPHQFRPERWLLHKQEEGKVRRLEKYLVPFSRGSRSCIGVNLAYAELYLTFATLFRRFELELFESTRLDVDLAHDYFNPEVSLKSKGVRVMVKKSRWQRQR